MALQDNRCTADPIFCVQVMDRHPVPDGHSDLTGYYDANEAENYYPDRSPEEWGKLDALESAGDDLPDGVESFNYVERWETKTVCFTENGCHEHLRVNGHNYREYFGTRIYVESFWRNEEMMAIREFLMEFARSYCDPS